jgi:hypothetical protein
MAGISYRSDAPLPPADPVSTARNAAFALRNAAEYLMKYAILAAEGVDRPTNLEIARNSIALALKDLGLATPDVETALLQGFERHMIATVRS